MTNHSDIDDLTIAHDVAVHNVLLASTLVSKFDGTDRDSLDELRLALQKLFQVNIKIDEHYGSK